MSDPTEEDFFAEAISGEQPADPEPAPQEPATEPAEPASQEPVAEPDPAPDPVAAEVPEGSEPVTEPTAPEINIPKARFDEVNGRMKEAEERAREFERQATMLAGQVQQIQQQISQQPQAPQPQPDPVDLTDEFLADPVGFLDKKLSAKDQEIQGMIENMRVKTSLEMTQQANPDEFEAAMEFVDRVRDPNLEQRIRSSANPGKTLMDAYRQDKLMTETGGDLNAYNQRVIEQALENPEILKKLGDKLRASQTTQAAPGGAPNVFIPPSVNSGTSSASATTTERLPETDEDILSSAMSG